MKVVDFFFASLYAILCVGGGVGISVITKVMYDTEITDVYGKISFFQKPWFIFWEKYN
jgi:hypothetical protein